MHATVRNLFFLISIAISIQLKALPPQGFSFSAETKDKYLQKVIDRKLWESLRWLKLGHYEKNIFGSYHSAFRGNLFIDGKGYDSPEQELRATVEAFFSESAGLRTRYGRHPQCQFLARRSWLVQEIGIANEDLLPCAERLEWKKHLNAKSISLIFAAADLGNPASSYGHTFLKLVNPENAGKKDLIDYGINYAANASASEGFMYAVKGLMGLYQGEFTMLPYHQKIREYINLEGRDIWEYPLNLTEAEVDFFVDHLLEIEKSYAPYYFFSDNCSYEILKVLEVVRPGLELSKNLSAFVIPIDTVKVVRRHSDLSTLRAYKKSLKKDYQEGFSSLSFKQKEALDEAVKSEAIKNPEAFNKKEQAEIYEMAMKYFAVKAYRTGQDYDEEIYKLSSRRAVLGPVTQDQKIKVIQPPDESHDSSAVYLGGGNHFYSLKFRSAFHDFEQSDFGTVPSSQMEMVALDFRYYDEEKKFSLDRFTFVDMINLNPSNQLDHHISWKMRADLRDPWTADLEAGGGSAWDLYENIRVGSFLTGQIYGSDFKGAGPELLFLFRPIEQIGISTSLTYFGVIKEKSFFRWHSKLNWNIRANLDVQFDAQNQFRKDDEYQMRIVKNFLF
jgi:hypothetical protein